MTTKPHFLTFSTKVVSASKIALPLLLAITLSACSTTEKQTNEQPQAVNKNELNAENNSRCQVHASKIAEHAESAASTAQYLAAAKAMNNCVTTALKKRSFNTDKYQDQQDTIMKMMAVATLNFIKAGDVLTATREVNRFKRVYPNQDLYFSDYTSFLDTATALLSPEPLRASQISSLNISRILRDEIERKDYWLNH